MMNVFTQFFITSLLLNHTNCDLAKVSDEQKVKHPRKEENNA